MRRESVKILIEKFGRKYSEILGIKLSKGEDGEIFKWFLAAILFGAPITEKAVIKTYNCFKKHGVLTPQKILATGWDGLVQILDEGSYTRYDFKTADKLLETMKNLEEIYDGSLIRLYDEAKDAADLTNRLKRLGKGIGEVTVSIFLRELRGIWEKAEPEPTYLVVLASKKLGIIEEENVNVAERLKDFWLKNSVAGKSFVNFETALLRLGKDFCRKKKCAACPFRVECQNPEAP
jgi:endonuclease III